MTDAARLQADIGRDGPLDPFLAQDPWLGARLCATPVYDAPQMHGFGDAWRDWRGTLKQSTSVPVESEWDASSPKDPWEPADMASSLMFKPSVASWLVLPPCSSHRPGTSRTEPIDLPLSQC